MRWRSIGVVGLAVLAVVGSLAHVRAGVPQEEESDVVNDLAPPVLAAVPPGEGEVVVRGIGFLGLSYASGLVLQLERHGIDAVSPRASRDGRRNFTSSRVGESAPASPSPSTTTSSS